MGRETKVGTALAHSQRESDSRIPIDDPDLDDLDVMLKSLPSEEREAVDNRIRELLKRVDPSGRQRGRRS